MAQRNIINPGKPSVDFCFQLYHICGTNCMHQKTVPIVPRTLAATGMLVWGAMLCGLRDFVGGHGLNCFEVFVGDRGVINNVDTRV